MDYKSSDFSEQIKFGFAHKFYAFIKFYRPKIIFGDTKFHYLQNSQIKFFPNL